ncbi:MAG: hypothetical protein HY080_02835 [Gammaproteobacteria bacterium]|nr:hypothetical protein [Gammaproteobacteria bacterium]
MRHTHSKDTDVKEVATEINLYLSAHPNAADSLEGIVTWWLARQRYSKATDVVQKALEILITEGIVRKMVRKGNKTVYFYKHKDNEDP